MRIAAAALALALLPAANAAGLKIALVSPAGDVPKLAEAEPVWVRSEIGRQLFQALGKGYAGRGHQWASTEAVNRALESIEFDPDDPKERSVPRLLALGQALGCDVVLLPVLERISQKNLGTSAILSGAGKPASETRVSVRLWALDVKEQTLRVPGKDRLEGLALGPYFGTTDRREMVGNPADKTAFINLENRKRAEQIAKASADAMRKVLDAWLGQAPPDR